MKRNIKILLCLAIVIIMMLSQGLTLQVYAANYAKANTTDNEYVDFTENNIKTTDLRKKSRLDQIKFSEYMKKFPSLSGIEDTLLEIQDEYNVNAILILAIVRLESGNGKSEIAKSRNNIGGIIVYEDSVRVYKSFSAQSECVTYMANLLSKHYLTEGGKYFSGYTLTAIAQRYSTLPDVWSDRIANMIYEIQKGIDGMIQVDSQAVDDIQVSSSGSSDGFGLKELNAVVRAGLFSVLTIMAFA